MRKNSHLEDALIELAKPSAESAEKRFEKRKTRPLEKRTEAELLADLSWGAEQLERLLGGVTDLSVQLGLPAHARTTAARDEFATLSKAVHGVKTFNGLASLWRAQGAKLDRWGFLNTELSKVAIAARIVTILTAVYGTIDGFRRNDPGAAFLATAGGVLGTVLGGNIFSLAALTALNLVGGIASAFMARFEAGLPLVTESTVRQRWLPELNHIGSCRADKGYRVDFSTDPWGSKKSWDAGLALDSKGRLLYVSASGKQSAIPTPNKAKARRARTTIDLAVRHGLL